MNVVLEFAPVGHTGFLEGAFAVAPAQFEAAGVAAVMERQGALAVEQAVLELALVDLAITAVPLAIAMPLTIDELAGIPTATRVVDAPLALQQTVDHFPTVAATVRQTGVWRQQ